MAARGRSSRPLVQYFAACFATHKFATHGSRKRFFSTQCKFDLRQQHVNPVSGPPAPALEFEDTRKECDSHTDNHTAQNEKCDDLQEDFEEAVCTWKSELEAQVDGIEASLPAEKRHLQVPLVLDQVPALTLPIDDVMLQDLSYEDLAKCFTDSYTTSLAVTPVLRGHITGSLRCIVLLQVSAHTGGNITGLRIPFLLDTGSPGTYLCAADSRKLGADHADFVRIEGHLVNVQPSSSHFEEINLVGTDILKKYKVSIDYRLGIVELHINC
mmetsp:Transcript_51111/g.94594  ORF Transcript_51111/g.94594 Transcript_51111/m.94594 type:complete len:270 (+) Transcript_51111:64-873(+)